MQTDPATPDRCGKCLHPDHDRECPSCDCRNMRPTPATPDEAVARYPYHENPVLVDALAFAHQRALVGLVHTAPDWRGCGFFPCNAYDAITEAALSRRQGDTVAALRGDLYLRLLDHYGSPRHAMDVATLVAAALGPGWTLSRQQALPLPSERGGQGDTVAARAESPEDIEARVGKMLVEAATLRTIRANGLDDIHEIRHIGAALTWGNTSDCDPADCKLDRAGGWDREKLLGIGADGAGDGR